MECGGGLVGLLCNVFVPSESLGGHFNDLWATLQTKFPFSLAASLQAPESVGTSDTFLPGAIGPLPLVSGGLSDVLAVIKLVVTVLIFARLVWYVIDRLTPQAVV